MLIVVREEIDGEGFGRDFLWIFCALLCDFVFFFFSAFAWYLEECIVEDEN